eukprot:gene17954-19749_t
MGLVALKFLLVATSVMVSCLTVDCWILRLPCKKEADFNVAIMNFKLQNNIITKFTRSDYTACVLECIKNYNCMSLNYKLAGGKDNCELNGSTVEKEKMKITANSHNGWLYYSTDYNTTKDIAMTTVCRRRRFDIKRNNPNSNTRSIMVILFPENSHDLTDRAKTFDRILEGRLGTMRNVCSCVQNLAVGKPSKQSSTFGSYGAHRANDGNEMKILDQTALTNADASPWWNVDLTRQALVTGIIVIVIEDTSPIDIRAGKSGLNNGLDNPHCAQGVTVKADAGEKYLCPPNTIARYVTIQLLKQVNFRLCEVKVYGIYIE